ncbi:hypothetical protein A3L09_03180 [Thermococcus profundus]|uniref:Uncharacterized protein n=1 Tax=Thermococcus profundus TaxID=49899 RepID=A0A2Z2MCA9_THEPR|nr:hypothetical protein [Thermococcus profundus]ASJ02322.1 hypothetical protein A3L09_03180 [Thermococcus profundus]
MKFGIRPKSAVMVSFLSIALYFFGIAALSTNYPLQATGGVFVGLLHVAILWGLWRGEEWGIGFGKYISFVDLIFSLLWMMLGVIAQGATLFALSALVLILLSDPEVEGEILGRL